MVATALGSACSSSTPDTGGANLPGRNDADTNDGNVGPITDSSVAPPTCDKLTTKVSDRPACDTCAKAKCCSEITACNASNDCAALQQCLAPCAQTDTLCILTCQEAHPKGGDLLQEVGSCAQLKCKSECPSETPDGDIFPDF